MARKTEGKLAATQRQNSAQPLDLALLLALGSIAAMPPAHADPFVITNEQTVTETQVLNTDETGTVEPGSTISTTGDGAYGINAAGANATFINSGTISTSGKVSYGINSEGSNTTITNSGSIHATGDGATGIISKADHATITNSGSIIYTGMTILEETGVAGIYSRGDNAIITNSGTISGKKASFASILSEGNNAKITNSGTISGNESGATHIFSAGENVTIINSGMISKSGEGSVAIFSMLGRSATITNSGTITSMGADTAGIASLADNATITNSGTISATGGNSRSIQSYGDNAAITNSGMISAEGQYASGIYLRGNNATITNIGTITTVGESSNGIYSGDSRSIITNSGMISTSGEASHGINSSGAKATITNSGSISTTGYEAHGIRSTFNNATITNSGLISATGSGSAAILGESSTSQTLNLLPGSRIVGAIDLGGGGDTINVYGTTGSAVLRFANADTINVLTPNAVKVGNGTVVVIDPTGESSRAQSLTALSTGIHTVISQSPQNVALMRPVKLAALEMTPGMLNLDTAPVAWGQVFGSQSRRGSDGQLLGFEHRYAGFMGGYEQAYHGDRLGLVAGVANGNTGSAMSGMDSDSVFAGLYRHTRLGELKLTGSLVAGVERHSGHRSVLDNLNGVETVRGTTTSYYLSPSVRVGRSYAVSPLWELRPSAVLGYSVGWYAGYTESGSTNANLTVGARTVQALTGRAQLEMARQTGWGEVSVRAGMQMRQTSQGAVTGTVGGSDFRFSAAGSNNVTGSYVGLGVRQVLRERLSLVADVEYGQLSGNEKHVGARVMLQYVF